jgi:threonyl-tRNA synthetase
MSEAQAYEESHLYRVRHSAAHVMAQAVLEIFPDGKVAIGPPIESGFYYDFDLPRALTPDDLETVEKRMREIIQEDHKFARREVSADEARKLFSDQQYKLELIDGLEAGQEDEYGNKVEGDVVISTYKHDTFEDLCRGPHVESTGQINPDAVKLLSVAGAYWRGDENRQQLQRIYGTAFETADELEEYMHVLEESEKRDHRRLGRELDLFSISPDLGAGLVLWHPKGGRVRTVMEDYARQRHLEGGYEFVYTPHIGKSHLWETSGHLNWYQEGMYSPVDIEGQEYYLKPMNCPFHIMIYKSAVRSYRDLPMRFAEFGTVYRYERSGVLHGLMRVRGFTQDDAHLFCRPDQMVDEIARVVEFSISILRDFGFEQFELDLSLPDPDNPGKYAGTEEQWQMAADALVDALDRLDLSYRRAEGEAVFYGPKIDIQVRDALNRKWQITTVQFDFWLPQAFEMEYIGEDGQPHRPFMVHRALFGSMERFFGVLLEHYAGAFPVWLAPVQAIVLPVTDEALPYAIDVAAKLSEAEIRSEVDERGERLAAMVRDAQMRKIPYMLVVGKREVKSGQVAVRLRSEEDLGAMDLDAFVAMAHKAIDEKSQV